MTPQPCLHTFTRAAYAGGRCEVIRERFGYWPTIAEYAGLASSDKVMSYGDVNSMYAWAMLGLMPVTLECVRGPTPTSTIDASLAMGLLGFVECTVEIPLGCYLPPLPFRHNGKLIFPVGRFSGTWTTEELQLLPMVNGRILSITKSVWFKGQPLFDEYVDFWYKYRHTDGDPARNAIGKQYLTNLYGKFGMNPEREKLWFFPTDEEFAEHKLTPMRNTPPSMGAYIETTNASPPYVIPHIAAWVTSRSRAKLWRIMHSILRAGFKIFYCDTDSVLTDAPIQSSTKLGDLKLECQVKRAWFVAPKLYFLEKLDNVATVKAKGFSGGFGAKGLTEAEFTSLVNHTTKVKVQRMRKLREGVRSGARFPAMKRSQKGLRLGILDEKRIHLPDGNTKPIDVTGI